MKVNFKMVTRNYTGKGYADTLTITDRHKIDFGLIVEKELGYTAYGVKNGIVYNAEDATSDECVFDLDCDGLQKVIMENALTKFDFIFITDTDIKNGTKYEDIKNNVFLDDYKCIDHILSSDALIVFHNFMYNNHYKHTILYCEFYRNYGIYAFMDIEELD